MDDQVGIAADRRREMRVASQRQAEMAMIVGTVDRLALAAQHGLVDQARGRFAFDLLQHAIEIDRPHLSARRQADAQRAEEVA